MIFVPRDVGYTWGKLSAGRLLDLNDAVLAPVLVPATVAAARVIGPDAVDNEPVLVFTGRKVESALPVAVRCSFQGSGRRVPVVECARHGYLGSVGCVLVEGDSFLARVARHILPL